ncbi:MAG: response regulator transcription factor [Chiayiivirga sp.]|uniref:response regulator transcription factor n=1 Tax=Chiayiivirga sp. TaxID=2041042 RepID=UPI0025B98C9F|nr:response regulator transcription factor [Chiayiivirga sp.]MCI1709364.1 response regulator transcription factor [Chiayiivirga sp.]MCI1730770.1 response regulator transcription factor [Chiayiivirga sp.]
MPMPRIALLDDHPIVRRGFKQLIETVPDHVVAVEHARGDALLADPALPGCQLLVLDLSLPDMDGFDVLRRLADRDLPLATLVLSMHEELPYVREALRLGARGYLAKSGAEDELLEALAALAQGEEYLGAGFRVRMGELDPARDAVFPELSGRELQVVRALVQGEAIKDIAAHLGMSRKTVYVHRSRALQKLDASSDVDLVRVARQRGWITPG